MQTTIVSKFSGYLNFLKENLRHQRFPKVGDIIEGEVIEKRAGRIFIDLGVFGTGLIYGRAYQEAQNAIKGLSVGSKVAVKILNLETEDGYIELSLKDVGELKQWLRLEEAFKNNEVLVCKVIEANRGGLLVEVEGIKGFVPVSQLSFEHYPRVEGGDKEKILKELSRLLDGNLKLRIISLNQKTNKLILSEKEAESEQLKEILGRYKVGDAVEGQITGVVKFGAFIRFGEPPIEGLIHISEIDHRLVEDPRDILKPGDKVTAQIVNIENGRVSLSLKRLKMDPWQEFAKNYQVGSEIDGEIFKITPYGILVKLEGDINGIFKPEQKETNLAPGQKMRFKLESISPLDKKILLTPAGSQ